MRTSWLAAIGILGACDYVSGVPAVTDTSESRCPTPGWEATTTAELTLTSFILDGIALASGFDPTAVYETGPAACADPIGGGAAWTFAVGDEPFATLTVQATTTGSLDLGVDGNVTVDVFGAESPVTFSGTQFVIGGWNVSTLSPTFATSLSGAQAQNAGRTLGFGFVAEATP